MKLVFLATHYNNQPEVESFTSHLVNVVESEGASYELLVADNSCNWCDDGPLPPRLTIVPVERNLGYLNGCSRALEASTLGRDADWVVLSNTDIEFGDGFFAELAGLRNDVAGLVAPRVIDDDGSEMNPFMEQRPSTLRMNAYALAFRYVWGLRMLMWLDALTSRRHAVAVASREVYAPHGSVVLISPSFLSAGGRLDYPAFLYGEEIHLAEQARRLGLRVVYEPSLCVRHRSGAVTGQVPLGQRCAWKLESTRFLRRAYFSRNGHTKSSREESA